MAKRKIKWSHRASLDLLEILDYYYKRNGTKTYSKKLSTKLLGTIRLLEKQNDLGVQSDMLNVKNLIEGDYNIFYEITATTIDIITIWDNRQNPENLHKK
jgi:toxin YoeB